MARRFEPSSVGDFKLEWVGDLGPDTFGFI